MYVDPNSQTMAMLYGNPAAMEGAQLRGTSHPGGPKYPTGAVLALVTWAQRDDPHWFGARIPAMPESEEYVQMATTVQTTSYLRFTGKELVEDRTAASIAAQRTNFILALTPARLP